MLWVEHASYMGPDRRLRASVLRLFERRHGESVSEPVSLVAAVRHLRARVGAADHAEGVQTFCRRARAVALLANAHVKRAGGDVLMDLVRQLESPSGLSGDPRPAIYAALVRVDALLAPAPEYCEQ